MIKAPLYPMRMTTAETNGLLDLIDFTGLSNIVMAELGSFAGESASVFLRSGKIQKFYAIDIWAPMTYKTPLPGVRPDDAEPVFDECLSRWCADGHDVVKMKMDTVEATSRIEDGSIDIVYIDAEHTYEGVIRDSNAWISKIRPDGYLSGHDYNNGHPGVTQAVDELSQKFGKPKLFQDSSWVFKIG